MGTAQIRYGTRDGQLVHIDDVERGLACLCTCPECGRALVAKKGEVLNHHFAHDADDVDCNPTPESLVHQYAKQQVSKLRELTLPGFDVRAEIKSNDEQLHELNYRHRPHYRLQVKSAEVEVDLGNIKPDVLCATNLGRVAVEVYFRHKVPPEKVSKLQEHYLSTVELNLSDIPVNASTCAITAAIADTRRWKWLHNQHAAYLRVGMSSLLARSTRIFVPGAAQVVPKLATNRVPSRKLAKADGQRSKAERLTAELRQLPVASRLQRVREVDEELRIALHCLQIGLLPTQLPQHLMQTTEGQGSLGMHPVVWETGVFAKFCMAGGEVSVKTVENWVRSSFDDKDLHTPESITQTTNGFSPSAEALYQFFLNLSAQGLLREIRGSKPWEWRFAPIKPSKAEVLELLLTYPSACSSA